MEGGALAATPREGACLAWCRRSTGRVRDSVIVSGPILPVAGELSYHRGAVVTITAAYWNRVIDALQHQPRGTGIAVLHTHPGDGVPEWSGDDDRADESLAQFLFGDGFLTVTAPLVSIVATHTDVRARELVHDSRLGDVYFEPITRVRTIDAAGCRWYATADRTEAIRTSRTPDAADRSIRVFGTAGQRQLADLHVAIVGTGGVGSMCAEDCVRWGFGTISLWDPDVVERANVNRSHVFTFADARRRRSKAARVARALAPVALVRDARIAWRQRDVRATAELRDLLDADIIITCVDDARPRHFLNRIALAHYIPVVDGGNVVRSTAEHDGTAENAKIEGAGVRVSVVTPGGSCLWCAGHLTSARLSLAYRPEAEKAADRACGYVEHLGPEHAPSVMPLNVMTAALIELRLLDLIHHVSGQRTAEVHYNVIDQLLDVLPRATGVGCRECRNWTGRGDLAELPHSD